MPILPLVRHKRPMGNARLKDSGVTLIEVLIVLVLIGVSAGVVTYALPSARAAHTIEQEANLLSARINLAAERSLISGQHYRLDWTVAGYRFLQWQGGAWTVAAATPLNEEHQLAGGALLSQTGGDRQGNLRITPDLVPSAEGVAQLRLVAGGIQQLITFDGFAAQTGQGGS